MTAEAVAGRARVCGLELGRATAARLAEYLELVLRWNRKMNLTSVVAEGPAIDRLLLEPVAAAKWLPGRPGVHLVDLGSGCGSPAIPLKLVRTDVRLTMVESRQRRAAFLREAIRVLALEETRVAECRFEALEAWEHWSGPADVASVRAVRLGTTEIARIRALVRRGGELLCFGGDGVVPAPEDWSLEGRGSLPAGLGWLSRFKKTK